MHLKMSSAEVVCCKYLPNITDKLSIEANSVDPEQTAPTGAVGSGLEVIKLEFILRLKIKCNDWLLADTCLQTANHWALF